MTGFLIDVGLSCKEAVWQLPPGDPFVVQQFTINPFPPTGEPTGGSPGRARAQAGPAWALQRAILQKEHTIIDSTDHGAHRAFWLVKKTIYMDVPGPADLGNPAAVLE
jgi:hypothetical protein